VSSDYLPTLYKARMVPTKQPVCMICVDRTRGRTHTVRLGYGVSVSLCAPHASVQFQRQRNGRDFVRTLAGVWQACGCLTQARHRALHAHLASLVDRPERPRPGSYAWPELRRTLEDDYAAGARPADIAHAVHTRYAACPAHPPSRRTLERWHHQHRWLHGPP
jgi:hypothetical protein